MGVRSIIKSIYSMFVLNDNQNQQTSTHQYDLPTYKIALTVILGFTIISLLLLLDILIIRTRCCNLGCLDRGNHWIFLWV